MTVVSNHSDQRQRPVIAAADWPELSVVQRWFQAVVTHPNGVEAGVESPDASSLVPLTRDELEVMITRSARVSARDRIAIYANAYYARLLECLADSYPVLKKTLGDEAFSGFAFGYLQQYPSSSYTLGKLGERFADYLAETRPDGESTGETPGEGAPAWPDFLIELARLEWTIAQVFDGPGMENMPVMQARQLAVGTAGDWSRLRLQVAPCLRLLATRFPLNAYYTDARRHDTSAALAIPAPGPSYLAITRRDYIVRRHELTLSQFLILKALQEEATLGEAIANAEAVAGMSEERFAAALTQSFQDWTCMQFFQSAVYPVSGLGA